MESLLDVVNSGDVASLIVLIVVLCWVGSWMVKRQPQLGQWGWRLAAAAFIGYCAYTGSELEYHAPAQWLQIVWRGILAAGLTAGVSWVVLAVYGFLKSVSDRASDAAKARAIERGHRKEQKRLEKLEQHRRKEWERQAPERERQQRIADEQRRQAEAARAQVQQTREDTRLACELFYNLHAQTIGSRFSKQELHEFLNRYMDDAQSLEVVQRRVTQLMETIRQHVDAVDPPEKIDSLEKLTAWYTTQKAGIENLGLDSNFQRMFVDELNEQYADRCRLILEDAKR